MSPDQSWEIGARGPEQVLEPLTRTDFVRYAGAGGDFNPIHHDEQFAARSGYPSVFGHGLLTAGLLSTYVSGWLGLANVRRFGVRYVDQVWPGDRLAMRAEISESEAVPDGRRVRCELAVVVLGDADERTVLRGFAEAEVGAR